MKEHGTVKRHCHGPTRGTRRIHQSPSSQLRDGGGLACNQLSGTTHKSALDRSLTSPLLLTVVCWSGVWVLVTVPSPRAIVPSTWVKTETAGVSWAIDGSLCSEYPSTLEHLPTPTVSLLRRVIAASTPCPPLCLTPLLRRLGKLAGVSFQFPYWDRPRRLFNRGRSPSFGYDHTP